MIDWREAAARMHVRTGFGKEQPADVPEPAPAKPAKPRDALEHVPSTFRS